MRVVNLSRKPFVNRRPILRMAILLWVIGVVLLIVNVRLYTQHWAGSAENRRLLAEVREDLAEKQKVLRDQEQKVAEINLNRLNRRAAFLNQLIDERTFPWSALFDDLAEVLPSRVRLGSVQPSVQMASNRRSRAQAEGEFEGSGEEVELARDEVVLRLTGVAETWEDLQELVERLYDNPFRDPYLSSTSLDRGQGPEATVFNLSTVYLTQRTPLIEEPAVDEPQLAEGEEGQAEGDTEDGGSAPSAVASGAPSSGAPSAGGSAVGAPASGTTSGSSAAAGNPADPAGEGGSTRLGAVRDPRRTNIGTAPPPSADSGRSPIPGRSRSTRPPTQDPDTARANRVRPDVARPDNPRTGFVGVPGAPPPAVAEQAPPPPPPSRRASPPPPRGQRRPQSPPPPPSTRDEAPPRDTGIPSRDDGRDDQPAFGDRDASSTPGVNRGAGDLIPVLPERLGSPVHPLHETFERAIA